MPHNKGTESYSEHPGAITRESDGLQRIASVDRSHKGVGVHNLRHIAGRLHIEQGCCARQQIPRKAIGC